MSIKCRSTVTFDDSMLLTSAHTSCQITGLKLGYRVGVGGRLLFGSPQDPLFVHCIFTTYEGVCVSFLSLSQAQYASNLKAN